MKWALIVLMMNSPPTEFLFSSFELCMLAKLDISGKQVSYKSKSGFGTSFHIDEKTASVTAVCVEK